MSKELTVIKNVELVPFFTKGDSIDDVLEQIAKEARALVPDVSNDKGRKAIKANVTKVTSSKTYLEAEGKELAAEYKEIPKLIDKNRKKVKDFLNDLQAEIRKPLTDWEEEQKRIEEEKALAKEKEERTAAIDADFDFAVLLMDTDFKERAEKAEQDRLAKIAHEKKIAEEAAAKAIADEQARQQAINDQIQREKVEAQQREERAKYELEQAATREANAKKQAAIDAENAEKRRLADIEAAKQAEIDNQKAIKQAELDAQAQAAANKAHVASVHSKLKGVYIAAGLTEECAIKAVKLLVKGKLPTEHVRFKY